MVLEHTAGERHLAEAGFLCQAAAEVGGQLGERPMEAHRDRRYGYGGAILTEGGLEKRRRIHDPGLGGVVDDIRVATLSARVSQRLELHGGLALVLDATAHTQKCSNSVEKPAAAGGQRSVQAMLHLSAYDRRFSRIERFQEWGERVEIAREPGVQIAQSHAIRTSDGARSAG